MEKLRFRYKPTRIKLLLVGEAPPAHKGFFYDTTAPEGQLSRNTRKVFQDHYRTVFVEREEFLAMFKARHCYLVDLFPVRGKNIQKTIKEERQNAVRQLTTFLQAEKPRIITPVLKRIQKSAFEAFQDSRIRARFKPLVYPTRQYIPQYQSGLQAILSEF